MMYEQTRYFDMEAGAVYWCPPGGMVVLCLENTQFFDTCRVRFFVIDAGSKVGWRDGDVVAEQYTRWSAGSWSRLP